MKFVIFFAAGWFNLHAIELPVACDVRLAQTQETRAAAVKMPRAQDARLALVNELVRQLPQVLGDTVKTESTYQLLVNYVLPAFGPTSPFLVTTIMGVANNRKSAIFSSIEAAYTNEPHLGARDRVSLSSDEAGETKQMVLMRGNTDIGYETGLMTAMDDECNLRYRGILNRPLQPGDPSRADGGTGVSLRSPHLPAHMAFVDTPGFNLDPNNSTAALDAVRSSDVLLLSVTFNTIDDAFYRETIRRIFQTNGARRIIFVIDGAKTTATIAAAQRVLLKLANEIYGIKQGTTMPDGVLGAYLMPYSAEAQANVAHGEYVPLATSEGGRPYLAFGELLRQMARAPMPIKRYGRERAIDAVVADYSERVKMIQQAQRAAEIYEQAFIVAKANAIQTIGYAFPFDRFVRQLIEGRKMTGAWRHVDRVIDFPGLVGAKMYDLTAPTVGRGYNMVRNRVSRWAAPGSNVAPAAKPWAEVTQPGRDSAQIGLAETLAAMNALVEPLGDSNAVTVGDESAPVMRLRALISAYAKDFSNSAREENESDGKISRAVDLPPKSVLDAQLNTLMNGVLARKTEIAFGLKTAVDATILNSADPTLDEANIFGTKNKPHEVEGAHPDDLRLARVLVMGGTVGVLLARHTVLTAVLASTMGTSALSALKKFEENQLLRLLKEKIERHVSSTAKTSLNEASTELRRALLEHGREDEAITNLARLLVQIRADRAISTLALQ